MTTELDKTRDQFDAKAREMISMASMMTRVKQLNAEQCREIEAQVALLERRVEEAGSCADQSDARAHHVQANYEQMEGRCRSLQASLADMIAMTDGLKEEAVKMSRGHDVVALDLQAIY